MQVPGGGEPPPYRCAAKVRSPSKKAPPGDRLNFNPSPRGATMTIHFCSLDMHMIINVIHTIAIVPIALGAIPELQVRVGEVGSAADGAAVGVGAVSYTHLTLPTILLV